MMAGPGVLCNNLGTLPFSARLSRRGSITRSSSTEADPERRNRTDRCDCHFTSDGDGCCREDGEQAGWC